ncbi:MAG: hypothetical protein NPIRA05_20520 [Nitrospirales bacterium]|nr:MAG: hypothetical protein NPIRA05_20520 [Nitrospirales bacterium]
MADILINQEGELPLDFDCQLSYHHAPLHGKVVANVLSFTGQMFCKK